MKHVVLKSLLGLSLVVTLMFSGCDLLENADDVSFDIEVDVTFVADENGQFTNKPYTGDPVLLDISSNSEIQKYKDKIKKVEVTKIEYSITSYTSEPPGTAVTMTGGTMRYSAATGGNSLELSSVATLNLMTAGATPKELPINSSSFNALGQLLLDNNQAYVFTQGTLSSTPVSFNVPTTFYLRVTANALD
jgi:hypothetical protein